MGPMFLMMLDKAENNVTGSKPAACSHSPGSWWRQAATCWPVPDKKGDKSAFSVRELAHGGSFL